MQSDINQQDDELFEDSATDSTEGSTSDGSTTEEAGFDPDNQGEETTTDGTKTTSEAEKAKQVDAWVRKIETGEATIEELAAKQKWLVPNVNDRLEARNVVKKQILTEEAQKLIREELERERQNLKDKGDYEQQLTRLRSAGLSATQKKIITEKFAELKGSLGKSKALAIAAEIARVEDSVMESRQRAGSIQYGGGVSEPERPDPNNMNRDQRFEELQRRRASRGY